MHQFRAYRGESTVATNVKNTVEYYKTTINTFEDFRRRHRKGLFNTVYSNLQTVNINDRTIIRGKCSMGANIPSYIAALKGSNSEIPLRR